MENNNLNLSRSFEGIWIPKEIWLSKELSLTEKVFLVEIKSLDNDYGCVASNAYFGEFFNLSKNRCSEIIKSLEKKEYITIKYVREINSKSIKKRIINISNKYFDIIKATYSENRQTYSKNRLPYSEKCEGNNIYNNIYKYSFNESPY